MVELIQHITALKERIDILQGERNVVLNQKQKLEDEINIIVEDMDLYSQVRRLLEVLVKSTEIHLRGYIEPLVTEALDFVFEQGLNFHLFFISRRNQLEIDFIVLRNSTTESNYQIWVQDPEKYEDELADLIRESKDLNYMYGGAINQVLSLVLRLVLVELLKIEGPVFFDEPSSAVGEQYSARLGQLISSLSKRFSRQIVLITHSSTLSSFADKLYRVEQINKVSFAKLEKE